MNVTAPRTVGLQLLPRLVYLVMARKQARWQWKHAAGEHERKWRLVLIAIDAEINHKERFLASMLDVPSFRTKREVVE